MRGTFGAMSKYGTQDTLPYVALIYCYRSKFRGIGRMAEFKSQLSKVPFS